MLIPARLHERYITRGAILHSEIFEDIDHGKFFAVIGVSGDMIAGFFFINSRIHPVIMKRPEQLAMQHLLKESDYDFLKYDSYLSAANLLTLSVGILAQSVADGKTSHVGQLTDADLATVLDLCRKSKLFSKSDKERFFY